MARIISAFLLSRPPDRMRESLCTILAALLYPAVYVAFSRSGKAD